MKKKIINGLLLVVFAFAATSSLVSCKDTNGDDNAALREETYRNKTLIVTLQEQVRTLETTLVACKCEIPFKQEYLDLLNNLDNKLGSLIDQIDQQGGIVLPNSGSGGTTTNLLDWINAVNQVIQDFQNRLATLEGYNIPDLQRRLAILEGINAADRLAALEGIDAANRLTALETELTRLSNQYGIDINDLKNRVTALENMDADNRLKAIEQLLDGVDFNNFLTLTYQFKLGGGDNAATGNILQWVNFMNQLTTNIQSQLEQVKGDIVDIKNVLAGLPDFSQFLTQADLSNYVTRNELPDFTQFLTAAQADAKIAAALNQYYTKDEITSLLGGYATTTTVNNIINQVNTLNDFMTQINNLNIGDRLKALEDSKVYYDTRIQNISDSLYNAYETIKGQETRLKNIEDNFATRQELTDSLAKIRTEIASKILEVKGYVDDQVNALTTVINTLSTKVDGIDGRVTTVEGKVTDLEGAVATLNTTVGELQTTVSNLSTKVGEIETKVGNIEVRVGTLETTVSDLKDNVIPALDNRLTTLENSVTALTSRVKAVEDQVTSICDAISKQVTGIIVQGVYSPVFGIGSLPLDVKTNVLAAYYGVANENGVKFPASSSIYFLESDMNNHLRDGQTNGAFNFSEIKGMDPIEPKGVIINDASDNAGKVYLTVNPNTVNFEDKIIELETTSGNACPMTLSPLAKSDYTIDFGWKRAASNGFYEADAKIEAADLDKAKVNVSKDKLVEAAKEFYHNRTKKGLTNFASSMYKQLQDAGSSLPAYGAKATFMGLDESGKLVEKSVYSEYGIAAAVLTPLSYNTLRDWNPDHVPGFGRIEKFADKLLQKIFDQIHFDIKLNNGEHFEIKVKEIVIKELTEEFKAKFIVTIDKEVTVSSTATVWVDVPSGEVYKDEDWDKANDKPKTGATPEGHVHFPDQAVGTGTGTGTASFSITVDLSDEINELYENIAGPVRQVNEVLDNLQDIVKAINEMIDQVNDLEKQIEDTKDKIKTQLHEYLDKIENKILSLAPWVNQALQPVMLISSGDGFKMASKMKSYPSQAPESSIVLVPTSFNAELLTPAYKKLVVVTNAWKNGTQDAAAARKANTDNDLLKVLEGTNRSVEFTGEAGVKYEIVYQAVDYHGLIASYKYYVQF